MTAVLISGRARPILLQVSEFGEALAIAVVGVTADGIPFSRLTSPRILKCLPEDVGRACHSFGTIVSADFMAWCHARKDVDGWAPPIGGLNVGEWIDLDAYDLDSMAVAVLKMCALYDAVANLDGSSEAPVVTPRSSEESRFLELVKSEVTRRRPTLKAGFRKAFSLTGKEIGGEIDFVGSFYATCYSAINPKGKAAIRVQTASAALWRLARARDAFGFAAPPSFELTAWVPPAHLPIFSERDYAIVEETVTELREEARREDLSVFAATDHSSASDRLITLEKQADSRS